MKQDTISQTRYRTLRHALVLVAISSLGGAFVVMKLPDVRAAEWLTFLAGAVVCIALIPLGARARARNDRKALERIALITVGVGTVLVLQRLAWSMYGPLIHDPT